MDCIIIHALTLTLCSTFPQSRVTIAYPGGRRVASRRVVRYFILWSWGCLLLISFLLLLGRLRRSGWR